MIRDLDSTRQVEENRKEEKIKKGEESSCLLTTSTCLNRKANANYCGNIVNADYNKNEK